MSGYHQHRTFSCGYAEKRRREVHAATQQPRVSNDRAQPNAATTEQYKVYIPSPSKEAAQDFDWTPIRYVAILFLALSIVSMAVTTDVIGNYTLVQSPDKTLYVHDLARFNGILNRFKTPKEIMDAMDTIRGVSSIACIEMAQEWADNATRWQAKSDAFNNQKLYEYRNSSQYKSCVQDVKVVKVLCRSFQQQLMSNIRCLWEPQNALFVILPIAAHMMLHARNFSYAFLFSLSVAALGLILNNDLLVRFNVGTLVYADGDFVHAFVGIFTKFDQQNPATSGIIAGVAFIRMLCNSCVPGVKVALSGCGLSYVDSYFKWGFVDYVKGDLYRKQRNLFSCVWVTLWWFFRQIVHNVLIDCAKSGYPTSAMVDALLLHFRTILSIWFADIEWKKLLPYLFSAGGEEEKHATKESYVWYLCKSLLRIAVHIALSYHMHVFENVFYNTSGMKNVCILVADF